MIKICNIYRTKYGILHQFFDNDREIIKKMKKMCNSFIKVKYTNLEQLSIT